jgi:hypothetical protein
MIDISPVIRKEKEMMLLFPVLKIVAGCGVETAEATRKRKIEEPEAASKDSRR